MNATIDAALEPRTGMRALFRSPLFWGVLFLKLVLGSLLASHYLRDLFVPFLNYFVESGFSDPWTHFAELGRLNSFPYPPLMLGVMALGRLIFAPFLEPGTFTVTAGHLFAMRLPLLACDLMACFIMATWFENRTRRVLLYYWCSPFVIYICYWHGQLDIVPTAFFLLALDILRRRRDLLAMAVMGLALATKTHLLVALPFLLVYLHQEGKWVRVLAGAAVALGVYAMIVAPFAASPAFRLMVFGTEEQHRALAFSLPVGASSLSVLLAPGAVAVLWFRFVAYARRDWDLLMLYMGILFSVFIVLAPPAPGYALWSLPFLLYFFCRAPRIDLAPYLCYCISYLAFEWLGPRSDLMDAFRTAFPAVAAWQSPHALLASIDPKLATTAVNLGYTVMQASLAGQILGMYIFGVRSNSVYRMRTTPVMIGVAGDSGSGKDTLTRLLTGAVGADRCTVIAGDDYHRWPRGHQMWEVHTHLDWRANELHRHQEHAIALSRGNSVLKGTYDHATGRFTPAEMVDPRQFLLFQGLHSLSLESVRELLDLKVFLDPEEELRCFWAVQRDCNERGYTPQAAQDRIARRTPDREKYILPQRDLADVVIRFCREAGCDLTDPKVSPRLILEVFATNCHDLFGLAQTLSREPGLRIDHDPAADVRFQLLRFHGTVTAAQLHLAARETIVDFDSFVPGCQFEADLNGCLQVVLLTCLNQRLRWRESGD